MNVSANSAIGGTISGAIGSVAGGYAGGFIGGAGNAWVNGSNFGDGIVAGIKGGAIGGVAGGIIGGVSGGVRANKQGLDFWGGKDLNNKTISLMKASGYNPDAPVNATDANLVKAQETWIPDAPMENVKSFTTENVPENIQQLLDSNGATAGTPPILANGRFTGKSHMFFNKNLAFRSAKELYYTMVHEFNHVSQHAILKGLNYSDFNGSLFGQLKEYTAYSHSASLGSTNYGGFAQGGLYYHLVPSIQNHNYYSMFQPHNFS